MSINLTSVAKELRKNATDAERLLWRYLRGKQLLGLKFRRQEQIGRFVVDFVCFEKALIVEADGSQHGIAIEKMKDANRTAWLISQGFEVLRFWNHEILQNVDGVLEVIQEHCLNAPSPQPSPTRGEGV